jgi:hypothetical protein
MVLALHEHTYICSRVKGGLRSMRSGGEYRALEVGIIAGENTEKAG